MTPRPFVRWGSRHVSVSVDWCPLCYRRDTAHLARCVAECVQWIWFGPVGQAPDAPRRGIG
jgi:hypothetical protein